MKMRAVAISLFFLLTSGCGGKFDSKEYLRENVDMTAISRIAVMPFQNFTSDQYVAERTRDIATTQLLASGIADVVDRGLVDSVMAEEVIDPRLPIDQINMKRLGQRLNVQAFLLGGVDLAGEKRTGSMAYPVLGVTMRLVDAQAGVVIWQSSGRWTSETVIGRILGTTPTDDFHVTLELLHRMLRSLAGK
jgi:TolB-like protein